MRTSIINNTVPVHLALPNPDVNIDQALCDRPCLKSIWNCPQINNSIIPGAGGIHVAGWICGWCSGGWTFKGDNATKALAHVVKIAGRNFRFCDGNIPQPKLKPYRDLVYLKSSVKADRSLHHHLLAASISDTQSRAIHSLEAVYDGAMHDNIQVIEPPQKRPFQPSPSDSTSTISSSSVLGNFFSKETRRKDKGQLKLWCSSDLNAQKHMNMAIADFIHSNYLPFSLTEDLKFPKLIETAKQLGSFHPPT